MKARWIRNAPDAMSALYETEGGPLPRYVAAFAEQDGTVTFYEANADGGFKKANALKGSGHTRTAEVSLTKLGYVVTKGGLTLYPEGYEHDAKLDRKESVRRLAAFVDTTWKAADESFAIACDCLRAGNIAGFQTHLESGVLARRKSTQASKAMHTVRRFGHEENASRFTWEILHGQKDARELREHAATEVRTVMASLRSEGTFRSGETFVYRNSSGAATSTPTFTINGVPAPGVVPADPFEHPEHTTFKKRAAAADGKPFIDPAKNEVCVGRYPNICVFGKLEMYPPDASTWTEIAQIMHECWLHPMQQGQSEVRVDYEAHTTPFRGVVWPKKLTPGVYLDIVAANHKPTPPRPLWERALATGTKDSPRAEWRGQLCELIIGHGHEEFVFGRIARAEAGFDSVMVAQIMFNVWLDATRPPGLQCWTEASWDAYVLSRPEVLP